MSITKRPGSKYWYSRFQLNGKPYLIATGETDQRRARQADARIQQEKRAEGVERPSGLGTMSEAAAEDIAATIERGTSEINYKALQERWVRTLARLGPQTAPAAITETRLIQHINDRRREGLRGQSIRKEVADIRRALIFAEKRGWIAKLPTIPKIASDDKDPKQAGKLISPDIVRTVLRECAPDAAAAAEFCVNTGLRFTEITRVQWAFISDAPQGSKVLAILRLPSESTKNRRARTVGLNTRALLIAKARYKEIGNLLFPQRHYSQALSRACKRLHLPYNVTMRDLRHTFASNALKASGDLSAVSKALGHSELETTALYLHSAEQDIIDLAAQVEAKTVTSKSLQSKRRSSAKSMQVSENTKENVERETRIELATSCLGSTSQPALLALFERFLRENNVINQHALLADVVAKAVSVGSVVTAYPRVMVHCGTCRRDQEQEQAPTYECLFCGSTDTNLLIDPSEVSDIEPLVEVSQPWQENLLISKRRGEA